jgi:hypothetical protein
VNFNKILFNIIVEFCLMIGLIIYKVIMAILIKEIIIIIIIIIKITVKEFKEIMLKINIRRSNKTIKMFI